MTLAPMRRFSFAGEQRDSDTAMRIVRRLLTGKDFPIASVLFLLALLVGVLLVGFWLFRSFLHLSRSQLSSVLDSTLSTSGSAGSCAVRINLRC